MMTRVRFVVASALLMMVACGPPAAVPTPKPAAPLVVAPPVASVTPPATKPAPKVDVCKPPGTGEVSDDETPTIGGVKKKVEPIPWLESRGVTKDAAHAWYAKRFAVEAELAETIFDNAPCWTLTVGDHAEEALACEHELTYSWEQVRALVVVVRSKKISAVLDVGLGMRALDWPGVRQLDLALAFEAGGVRAELRDRAPDGTILVESRTSCHEAQARLDACEDQVRKGEEIQGACPIVRDKDDQAHVDRTAKPSFAPGGDDPVVLHDCEAARADFKKTVREMNKIGGEAAKEAREASAFVTKTCGERGRYVWKTDRFVRERAAASSNSSF